MCLAVPGRILRLFEADDTVMSDVDFGGVVKQVCLQYIPDAAVGDYVIVHVGFALQKLDENSATVSRSPRNRPACRSRPGPASIQPAHRLLLPTAHPRTERRNEVPGGIL